MLSIAADAALVTESIESIFIHQLFFISTFKDEVIV